MADDNMPGEHRSIMCAADDVTLGKCKPKRYMSGSKAVGCRWLPMAFRRTRCLAGSRVEDALFWTGVVYNLCAIHRVLDATSADLTDHAWMIDELL